MPISIDDAMKRLVVQPNYDDGHGPRPCVHTFRQAGPALLGAHHGFEELKADMEKWGVDFSGPAASAMGHGLVLVDDHGPLFIEAASDKEP